MVQKDLATAEGYSQRLVVWTVSTEAGEGWLRKCVWWHANF